MKKMISKYLSIYLSFSLALLPFYSKAEWHVDWEPPYLGMEHFIADQVRKAQSEMESRGIHLYDAQTKELLNLAQAIQKKEFIVEGQSVGAGPFLAKIISTDYENLKVTFALAALNNVEDTDRSKTTTITFGATDSIDEVLVSASQSLQNLASSEKTSLGTINPLLENEVTSTSKGLSKTQLSQQTIHLVLGLVSLVAASLIIKSILRQIQLDRTLGQLHGRVTALVFAKSIFAMGLAGAGVYQLSLLYKNWTTTSTEPILNP